MSQGIQIWDSTGKNMLDTTDRVTQLFGVVEIPENIVNGSGSIVDDRLMKGTPFWIVTGNLGIRNGYKNGNGTHRGFWMDYPNIYPYNCEARNIICSFDGPVMSWKSWSAANIGNHLTASGSAFIYYGCY